MLNKLFSNNPEDKKLQTIVGIALSALVLIFCFLSVYTISVEVFGFKTAQDYTLAGFAAENPDLAFLGTLNTLIIICAIGSIALLVLPMAGIELKLPTMINWLPAAVAGAAQALGIIIGWLAASSELKKLEDMGMSDAVKFGPNLMGWIAIVAGIALAAYAVLMIKGVKAPQAAEAPVENQ